MHRLKIVLVLLITKGSSIEGHKGSLSYIYVYVLLEPAIAVGMREELITSAMRSKLAKTSFILLMISSPRQDQAGSLANKCKKSLYSLDLGLKGIDEMQERLRQGRRKSLIGGIYSMDGGRCMVGRGCGRERNEVCLMCSTFLAGSLIHGQSGGQTGYDVKCIICCCQKLPFMS